MKIFRKYIMAKFIKSVGRSVRKAARKVRGAAIKRYFGKGYKPKISQIARDVNKLRMLVNAEKKRLASFTSQVAIGQLNANGNGYYVADITPNPSLGTGYNERNGNSIKWLSSHWQIQISQQANCGNPLNGRIMIIQVKGQPITLGSSVAGTDGFVNKAFLPNAFITGGTIYDYNSQVNPDFYAEYKVIRTKRFSIPVDAQSGNLMFKTFSMGLKHRNCHIRWNSSGALQHQYLMVVLVDTGNCGTTASTITGGVMNTQLASGVLMASTQTHYYTDN